MKKWNWQHWVKVIVLTGLGMLMYFAVYPQKPRYDDTISYVEFQEKLQQGDIDRVTYYSKLRYAIVHEEVLDIALKMNVMSATTLEEDVFAYANQVKDFQYHVSELEGNFNYFQFFMLYLLVIVLFHMVWDSAEKMITMKKGEGNTKKDGKKKKALVGLMGEQYVPRDSSDSTIKFSDVIGLEKQIDDIRDVVLFLKQPQKYMDIGATLPKGILLYGKSGVGKTHIARAIAGEAEVPFYELSATEIESKWVGESEANIRKLFETARENAPSIIYLDEIDSIATKRYNTTSTNKHYVGVINQLLSCMDGFDNETNVVVIASTNHVEELDDAILRSGRFDRKIYIHEPDKKAREQLVKYYASDKIIEDKASLMKLAEITTGMTGADIKTILNEAAIMSVKYKKDRITDEILMEAFRKVVIGSSSSHAPLSEEEQYKTAIHEAGHAVVSHYFGKKIEEISIIPRGSTAGYNLKSPSDRNNLSYSEIEQEIIGLLGGRAAEETIFEEVSSGASRDLEQATMWIREMFLRFAMEKEKGIGLVMTNDTALNNKIITDSYPKMNQYMQNSYMRALQIMEENKVLLMELAELLMTKETLSSEEIEKFFKKEKVMV